MVGFSYADTSILCFWLAETAKLEAILNAV